MADLGPLLLEIDANSFVLEWRDKLCKIHGLAPHRIRLVLAEGCRQLNMFDKLDEIIGVDVDDETTRSVTGELMLCPTRKTDFSNDFWSYYVDKTMSKNQFLENMTKKLFYLRANRNNKTPQNISKIKQKLTKKEKISKIELNEFVLWNDVM